MEESAEYSIQYDFLANVDDYKPSYQRSDEKFIPLKEVQKEQKNREKQNAIQDRLARVRFLLNSAIELLSDESSELLHDESASLTPLIESALWWFHGNKVAVQEPAEVSNYLLRYPDLIDILPEICTTVIGRFGKDAQLLLRVRRDPGLGDGYLALYVRRPKYDEQILDTIDEIHSEYEEELKRRKGWLIITTDFLPPT